MRENRIKYPGAIYHCMTRAVGGERLFQNREKEVLRKMLWQVAEFSGGEILTYCLMSNHFHVLIHFPEEHSLSDDRTDAALPGALPEAKQISGSVR